MYNLCMEYPVHNYNVKKNEEKFEFSYDIVCILYEDVIRENSITHNL